MTEQEEPRLYTRQEAVILGRRAICESSDTGHQITLAMQTRNQNGDRAWAVYGCANCDVDVALSYPPLPGDTL